MHELSIVAALIERVEAEARARAAAAVGRVEVAIGELSGVDPDLLATAYSAFRAATVCAGAELVVRTVPARWRCPGCGGEPARGGILACPSCRLPARLAAGDEIVLERIHLEVCDV
jgi:hydrogenase nickel incorporation protein HypA/HybF